MFAPRVGAEKARPMRSMDRRSGSGSGSGSGKNEKRLWLHAVTEPRRLSNELETAMRTDQHNRNSNLIVSPVKTAAAKQVPEENGTGGGEERAQQPGYL